MFRFFARRKTAPQPSRLSALGAVMAPSGAVVSPETAMTVATVWRCVQLISSTLAMLPWRVYERRGQNVEPALPELERLLSRRASPEMSAMQFRRRVMADVLLFGNAFAEIERYTTGDRSPIALHILDPRAMTIERDAKGQLLYRYRLQTGEVVLRPEEVLHFAGLGFDGVAGMSVISFAARSLGLGISAETYGSSLFRNGANIGGVIKTDQPLTASQRQEIEEILATNYSGAQRAHKTLVLSHGMEWQATTVPPTDAQFLETRQFTVEEICRWFGVPPNKAYDMRKATFANFEEQSFDFYTDTLQPWAAMLCQEVDYKLIDLPQDVLPRRSRAQYTQIDFDQLLLARLEDRAAYYQRLRDCGVLSVNEIRRREGLNPIGPEGDVHVAPLNFGPLAPSRDDDALPTDVMDAAARYLMRAKEAR